MNLAAIAPAPTPAPERRAQTPFQLQMTKAADTLSYGLQALGDAHDPTFVTAFEADVAKAITIANGALSLDAPSGAIDIAKQAVDQLGAAAATLAQSDDDGYPLNLKSGVDQVRAGMNLLTDARSAAVVIAPNE